MTPNLMGSQNTNGISQLYITFINNIMVELSLSLSLVV